VTKPVSDIELTCVFPKFYIEVARDQQVEDQEENYLEIEALPDGSRDLPK